MRCDRIAAAFLAPILAMAVSAAGEADAEIEWHEDYGSALKEAKQKDRLIIFDFYTSWCLFCKTLDKEVFGDPKVIGLARDFTCAKLDAEVQKAAATRYHPEGYPTILFATPTGEEILRVSGYRPPEEMIAVIERVHEVGPGIARHLAAVKKNKKDLAAREALGRLYLDLGLADRASEHLSRALKRAAKAREPDAKGEPAVARIEFLLGKAALVEEDYGKASRTFRRLVDGYATSPRREEYLRELERAYVAWGKTDEADAARQERERLFPQGG